VRVNVCVCVCKVRVSSFLSPLFGTTYVTVRLLRMKRRMRGIYHLSKEMIVIRIPAKVAMVKH
jgi:hypothetical protein